MKINGTANGHPRIAAATEPASDSGPATLDDVARLLRGIQKAIAAGNAELLDSAAAAAFLGVGRTKFFEMVSAVPQLKPVKLPGAGRMWRRVDLAAFVESLAK